MPAFESAEMFFTTTQAVKNASPDPTPGGGGRQSWEFLLALCRPILQILTLFQTKIVIFPFSDFRPEIMSSLLRLERKQKDFLKSIFEFALSLFLSYSFGVEKPNMFIHSRSSLENYTRFQTKMGTASTRFRTETAQGPNLLGRACTYLYGLNKEIHPPRFNKIS